MNDQFLSILKEKPGRLDNERLLDASLNCIQSINYFFASKEENSFHWLQSVAMPPFYQHMCFNYKSLVLSIFITPVDGDVIYVSREEMDYYEPFRKNNNLTAALIPVSLDTLMPIKEGLLLDPQTLQPMDLETLNMENEVKVMSPWEVSAMSLFEVGEHLNRKGYQFYQFTNVPGLYPQMVVSSSEGERCHVIVHGVAIGNKDTEQTLEIHMYSQCREIKGYFVYLWYSNLWSTLDFNETWLFRQGGQLRNDIELVPLSEVNTKYPNIHLNIVYHDQEE